MPNRQVFYDCGCEESEEKMILWSNWSEESVRDGIRADKRQHFGGRELFLDLDKYSLGLGHRSS